MRTSAHLWTLYLVILPHLAVLGDIHCRFSLSSEGTGFLPNNPLEYPLKCSNLSSALRCAKQCLEQTYCSTFVYDSAALLCQLYQSDLSSGNLITSPSTVRSRVGAIYYDGELFSNYNRTCDQCQFNRYFTCRDDRCQCPSPGTFWDGSVCRNQLSYGEACSSNSACREDLNLTCVFKVCDNDTSLYTKNWLVNGDAESGPCSLDDNVTHPTAWSYNGTITQISYNNSIDGQKYAYPGPSARGKCYFIGQMSLSTSMWQYVNITPSISAVVVDNGTVRFNLSTWLGGYLNTDDNAQVFLTFVNQTNQVVGNRTTLGPVLSAARNNLTSLLFRQSSGFVPIGARSALILITMTRLSGSYNDGATDNIVLYFN